MRVFSVYICIIAYTKTFLAVFIFILDPDKKKSMIRRAERSLLSSTQLYSTSHLLVYIVFFYHVTAAFYILFTGLLS